MPRKHPTKKCDDCGIPVACLYPPPKRCIYCAAKFRTIQPEKRFWNYVKKTEGCWEWKGFTSYGYGILSMKNGTPRKIAHRFSWELHNGPIPKGLCVLHKCDNPPCTKPEHLFLGTRQENMADKIRKGRQPRGIDSYLTKIDESTVKKIRELYIPKIYGYQKIAKHLNIGKGIIAGILSGRSWKHIK